MTTTTVDIRDPRILAQQLRELRYQATKAEQAVQQYLPGILAGTIQGSRPKRRALYARQEATSQAVAQFLTGLTADERGGLNVLVGAREF